MPLRNEILDFCYKTLQVNLFKDYAPNGLQIEGKEKIQKIVTAVTASQAAIDYAVQQQADMLLVHHGMFWKSEPTAIIGWKKQRIATLLQHNINMVAYHLPLDAHVELGNNAQLAIKMGWALEQQFGEQNLLNLGRLPESQQNLSSLLIQLARVLNREPVCVGEEFVESQRRLEKIVWCTGGAQGYFQAAIDMKADVYLTGEISEAQYHLAKETETVFISAGHHATERYGIQALGQCLADHFLVDVVFFDEANPA